MNKYVHITSKFEGRSTICLVRTSSIEEAKKIIKGTQFESDNMEYCTVNYPFELKKDIKEIW